MHHVHREGALAGPPDITGRAIARAVLQALQASFWCAGGDVSTIFKGKSKEEERLRSARTKGTQECDSDAPIARRPARIAPGMGGIG